MAGAFLRRAWRASAGSLKNAPALGPRRAATLRLELALPAGPGPFPIFVTQRNHTGWARVALARGYAAVAYNGCDAADDTQAFKDVWPDHDWSMLCRRAWGAGRVLDWLHTVKEVDAERACITGHSRNGKLSLICGAIDERFGVVISSSSGVGGASPYRFANEAQFSEGIEIITFSFPEWLHPRLRFFAGREDRLPIPNAYIACRVARMNRELRGHFPDGVHHLVFAEMNRLPFNFETMFFESG